MPQSLEGRAAAFLFQGSRGLDFETRDTAIFHKSIPIGTDIFRQPHYNLPDTAGDPAAPLKKLKENGK